MLRPGFEPGICDSKGLGVVNWDKFRGYLVAQKNEQKTIYDKMRYAKQYYQVLETGDASTIAILSESKRKHIMKSLASLAKFLGCYDRWKSMRENYQLKWSSLDSFAGFQNITQKNDFKEMVLWIQRSMEEHPRFKKIFLYNVLTGLRPDESIQSFNLLSTQKRNYLNEDGMLLEHFRFPQIFLRKTKKAFISIVNREILELAKGNGNNDIRYHTIRLTFKRNNQAFNMSFCRKVFATFLRQEGTESEIIDLLQGRIPNSMFVKHYYRPDLFDTYERIREKITKLHEVLIN